MPGSVRLVTWLARLNLLLFAVPTILAALDHERVRRYWRTELAATESAADYSASEIAKAVNVGLGTLAAIGLLMCLFELSAAKKLRGRSSGARMTLILLIVVHLPIVVAVWLFRYGDLLDLFLTALQLVVLLVLIGLALLPGVKRWLAAKPPLAVNRVQITPYLPPSKPPTPPPTPKN